MPIHFLTDWRPGLDAGDLSAIALTQVCLDHMDRLDPKLHATTHTTRERAHRAARDADQRLRCGERGPLLGIPFLVKDNLALTGEQLSNASLIQGETHAIYTATVVQRLLDAGAVPIAKTNLDEFAMGSSGENSALGPTRNPWDRSRVPGGSSSGSAAAVAAGYAPFALGSDTGGSVRLPAAFCGVSGFRPTYGALSRYGLTAMASSLDQVGLIARSVGDLALCYSVMTGLDPLDSTSVALPDAERLRQPTPASWKGVRIGLPVEYFTKGLEPGVEKVLRSALKVLADEGAEIREVSLPHTPYAIDAYYIINTAEVSSNLARFDGVRFGARQLGDAIDEMIARTRDAGFGTEAKRRILLGTYCLSKGFYEAYYIRAQKARRRIWEDFSAAFQQVDVLLTPASPTVAFPLETRTQDPMAMYLSDIFSVAPSLAALPCLSIPAGFSEGMPVGLQLIAPPFGDVRLLELAQGFQAVTKHHEQAPDI